MPEKGDKYFHIPVRSKNLFQKGSFRTINITAGVKAVIGRPKGKSTTMIQKFLLSVKKFKTLEKAKAWVRKRTKKKKSYEYTDEISIKSLLGTTDLRFDMYIKSFRETEDGERLVHIEISNDDVDAIGERIMKSALQDIVDSINSGRDIILYNHDMYRGIGKAKNARVIEEGGSARAEIDGYISKTEDKIWTQINEGVLKGASIGFTPTKVVDEWYDMYEQYIHEIHNLSYFETSLCYMPINQRAGIKYIKN